MAGTNMDVHIQSKDGPQPDLTAVADQVKAEIRSQQQAWLETLTAEPGRLGQVEHEIHQAFANLADHVVAAVLAEASERPEMAGHKKKRSTLRRWPLARPSAVR